MSDGKYHPMIPPNCPYFKDHKFETLPLYDGDSTRKYYLNQEYIDRGAPPPQWLPIICAVARTAWLDAPMPSETDWIDGSPVVLDYIEWMKEKLKDIQPCPEPELTEATWSGYRLQRAADCADWGQQELKKWEAK